MRLKWAAGEIPARKEHQGYTFLRSNYGQSALRGQANDRARYPAQFERMQCLMRATSFWRTMSPATQAAWETFAATYPQPQKRNPDLFLSGYQLFIRRNSYCFLNHAAAGDFMTTPVLEVAPEEAIEFHIRGGTSVVDCTELYIARFGVLPAVGDYIFLKAIVQGEYNGKMYPSYNLKLQVEEVYIDGLFIELTIPKTFQGITISLYLSRPVSAGQFYNFSKQRYMGCFTTKKFTELQDTPNTYAGAAGSCVKVNATEDALEFAACGGGGLDCDSLLECYMIQQILNILSISANTSIPQINYGLLYNLSALIDIRGIGSTPDWQFLNYAALNNISVIADATTGAPKIKDTDPIYWFGTSPVATNELKFNARGGAYVARSNGSFVGPTSTYYLTSKREGFNSFLLRQIHYNSTSFGSEFVYPAEDAFPARLFRNVSGIATGTSRVYSGNNGRVYRTIVIGNYEYLADNLAESKFRNGDLIPLVSGDSNWTMLSTPACRQILDDPSYT